MSPNLIDTIHGGASKWAYTTRRVERSDVFDLDRSIEGVKAGDLVLARVLKIGSHKKIQLTAGRGSQLYVGDFVVLACGARYASDQFEGVAELDPNSSDMLAGGGLIGKIRHKNARISAPTSLAPLGILRDRRGRRINLTAYGLRAAPPPTDLPTIAFIGASMNAGKTTSVASLAHGLSRAGFRVAAIKATGTGAFGDINAYIDAGAAHVSDFVDVGMPSTYQEPIERIERGLNTLLSAASVDGCDVALVEFADGLFQGETAALLRTPHLRSGFDGLVYAAPDSAAASGGCAALKALGVEPAIVTGIISSSPLAAKEAEAVTGIDIVGREELRDPSYAGAFLASVCREAGSQWLVREADRKAVA